MGRKGSLGTSSSIEYIKDPKKYKYKSTGVWFCSRCRTYMEKGTMVVPFRSSLVAHLECPKRGRNNGSKQGGTNQVRKRNQ